MSFSITSHTLAADLETDGTVDIDYPSGFTKGDFLGAYGHTLSAGQDHYDAPTDFTVALNASNFTVTWNAANTLPSGTTIDVQLDRPGGASGRQLFDGVEIPASATLHKLYVSLGSPVAADADGLVASVTPADGGVQALTLLTEDMDVPRNVTVTSTGDESGRTFTVTGTDVFGQAMVEEITGANAGAAAGEKAFATVTSITVDDDTADAVTAGWGTVLGLPVFVGSTGAVQRYEDGSAVSSGTLTAADTDAPTATTGDVRGTWSPSLETAPDGDVGYAIEIETTDPGYVGATNYAG